MFHRKLSAEVSPAAWRPPRQFSIRTSEVTRATTSLKSPVTTGQAGIIIGYGSRKPRPSRFANARNPAPKALRRSSDSNLPVHNSDVRSHACHHGAQVSSNDQSGNNRHWLRRQETASREVCQCPKTRRGRRRDDHPAAPCQATIRTSEVTRATTALRSPVTTRQAANVIGCGSRKPRPARFANARKPGAEGAAMIIRQYPAGPQFGRPN